MTEMSAIHAATDKHAERADLERRLAEAKKAKVGARARRRPWALKARRGNKAAQNRLDAITRDEMRATAAVEELELAVDALDGEIDADWRRETADRLRRSFAKADVLAGEAVAASADVDRLVDELVQALDQRRRLLLEMQALGVARGDFAVLQFSADASVIRGSVLGRLSWCLPFPHELFSGAETESRVADITVQRLAAGLDRARMSADAEIAELEREADDDDGQSTTNH